MEEDWKRDPIASALLGENPTFVGSMRSGIVMFGYTQFLPGYCLLIATSKVTTLNDLNMRQRTQFLIDMSILGDAIMKTCNPLRVNYSIYGNDASFLHAHVFPRYEWELEYHRKNPVWTYPETNWTDGEYQWSNADNRELKVKISNNLKLMMDAVYE